MHSLRLKKEKILFSFETRQATYWRSGSSSLSQEMADKQSPKKDQKPSPASKTSKDGSHHGTGAPPAPSAAEDHVSGQPVKQSLFGKMRSMSMSAKESLTRFAKVIPSKDTSDVKTAEDLEDTGRPKTGTKTSTDDDGPVWEPGTEQLMWTDPTYVVEKFVQPGIHPNHNENFVKPEVWWNRFVPLLSRSSAVSGCPPTLPSFVPSSSLSGSLQC